MVKVLMAEVAHHPDWLLDMSHDMAFLRADERPSVSDIEHFTGDRPDPRYKNKNE